MNVDQRVGLLRTAKRPLKIEVKRNAALTLQLLAQGAAPGSLPPETLPKNFKGEGVMEEMEGEEV